MFYGLLPSIQLFKNEREIQDEYNSDLNLQMKQPCWATEFDNINELMY